MLNADVHERYTNHQYQNLVNPGLLNLMMPRNETFNLTESYCYHVVDCDLMDRR